MLSRPDAMTLTYQKKWMEQGSEASHLVHLYHFRF
ncbi:hypothetical protein WG66_004199 [Moniliophthora roreri]|nr:hypothetical protein WG66_004199 [Moniliophthora roreri]